MIGAMNGSTVPRHKIISRADRVVRPYNVVRVPCVTRRGVGDAAPYAYLSYPYMRRGEGTPPYAATSDRIS